MRIGALCRAGPQHRSFLQNGDDRLLPDKDWWCGMLRFVPLVSLLLSLSLLSYTAALADQVVLKNGDRFSGTAQGAKDNILKFESPVLGVLDVPLDEIDTLMTDDLVTIEFVDGGKATGTLAAGETRTATITGDNDLVKSFALDSIKVLYPGAEIPEPRFVWRGNIDFGASQATGNSNNDKFRLSGTARGRGETDRVTLRGEFNRETSGDTVDTDDALLSAKYDYFFSGDLYFVGFGSVNRDETQDLNLRKFLSPGLGYQLIETEKTELSIEAGPSYVQEDLIVGNDRSFMAARWGVDFKIHLFDRGVVLFHNHEGLLEFDDSSILLRSRQGIRIPLRENLNASVQLDFDYDMTPPEGTEKEDIEYFLTLGYTF